MSVSRVNQRFHSLNALRPKSAMFGEVVAFELYVHEYGEIRYLGRTKRKSIHVPPSSNAYWNWKALESLLVQWCSERGITREQRIEFKKMVLEAVRQVHEYELRAAYSDDSTSVNQYYRMELRRETKNGTFLACDVNPS